MDWFTILLIFLFFVLPVIQQVMGQAKKGKPTGHLPPADDLGREAGADTRLPARTSDGEESWSDGWLTWPTEDENKTDEDEAGERLRQVAERLRALPSASPAPAPANLPTLRPPVEIQAIPRAPLKALSVADDNYSFRRVARPAVDRLGLRRKSDVRRALVLREVLGPPRALRGPEIE